MQININSGGAAPISEQIRSQLADAIAGLQLRSGDRLTPPAELAADLVTSPTAVRKAYRALEAEGLCRRVGSDLEVAPASIEQRRKRARLHHIAGSRQSLLEELELARKIQQQLLPPALVEADGYAVAARVHSADFVSGDFYDILPRGGGIVDVVVADVSGKGVGASLIMAFVKAMVPLLPAARPVGMLLRQLNRQLHVDLGPRQFVAMAYVRFSTSSGRAELANAGLPYPHLLRSGRRPESVVTSAPSLPLGVKAELDYLSRIISLGPSDRLLLYSDGLPEAPTSGGEPLGYRELSRLLESYVRESERAASVPSLGDWLDGFLGRIGQAADGPPADDQTALVLERRGA